MDTLKLFIKDFFSGMPGNLKRVTSGSGFIPEIDGLRFLAILPVVLFHFSERCVRSDTAGMSDSAKAIAQTLSHGHIGVYIFFAVSGFILAMPFGKNILLHQPALPLGKYYLRRLTRLEPPYVIIMTGLFLVLVVVKHQDFFEFLPHYGASLLYIHRLVYNFWTPINPPAWTLEIEVQFYILAPFLAMLYFRIKGPWVRRGLLILLIASKIIIYNVTTLVDPFYLTLPFSVEFFLVGIVLCDIFLVEWKDGIRHHVAFDLLAVASFITLFISWSWAKELVMSFVFILALFLLCYASFRGVVVNQFLRNPWISAIGGMCYTIYLLHLAFAELFVAAYRHFLPHLSFTPALLMGLVVFLPALFLLSSVFFRLIEKPCMDPRWPSKLKAKISSLLR